MFKATLFTLFVLLFSCTNKESTRDVFTDTPRSDNDTFPAKELIVDNGEEEGWGADIRLSIVSKAETDTASIYTAASTYQGKKLGLIVSVPKKKEGEKGFANGITLKSIGAASDNLLQVLATLYKQRSDSGLKFTNSISTAYVNLDEFAKSLGAENGGNYKTYNQYKLFFEGSGEDEYAELYLNISLNEHWIELREKDEEYRPQIIKFLKQ